MVAGPGAAESKRCPKDAAPTFHDVYGSQKVAIAQQYGRLSSDSLNEFIGHESAQVTMTDEMRP
jgi:hypothetical protein